MIILGFRVHYGDRNKYPTEQRFDEFRRMNKSGYTHRVSRRKEGVAKYRHWLPVLPVLPNHSKSNPGAKLTRPSPMQSMDFDFCGLSGTFRAKQCRGQAGFYRTSLFV